MAPNFLFLQGFTSSTSVGITELTGDVTAGPGSGPQAASVVGLQGIPVSGAAPSPGFKLSYDGTQWMPDIGGSEYFFGGSLTQNPASNVYSSWTDMLANIALQPTGVTPQITVVENTTVPAGIWDLRSGNLKSPYLATGAVTLTVPTGCTLDNLALIDNGLTVEVQPTVAGESLTFTATPGFQALVVGLAGVLRNTGTLPAWVTPGGGTTCVLALNATPWNAWPTYTAPIAQVTAGDTFILNNVLSIATIPADIITGTGVLIQIMPVNEGPPTLSGWTGITVTQQAQVVYPALAAYYEGSVAVDPPVASGGTYNVVRGDELVRVAPTGVGNISVVLPDPVLFKGQTVTVKKTTSDIIDAVTMTTVVGLIDGLASYPLPASAYSVLGFRSDGADWWVV